MSIVIQEGRAGVTGRVLLPSVLGAVLMLAGPSCGNGSRTSPGTDADADVDADADGDGDANPNRDAGAATDAGGDVGGEVAALAVGDPCGSEAECPAGGSGAPACLTDGYPGGYCSVVDCEDHGHDCPDDAGQGGDAGSVKCVVLGGNQCMRLCDGPDDCREGYVCAALQDAAGHGTVDVCAPDGSAEMSADAGMGGGMGGGMEGDGGMGGGGGM